MVLETKARQGSAVLLVGMMAMLAACGSGSDTVAPGDGGAADAAPSAPAAPSEGAQSHLSAEDRETLATLEGTSWGFACWVADELYFINNGYQSSIEEMTRFVVRNPTSQKHIAMEVFDLKNLQPRGGKAVAQELYERLKAETGPEPARNPNAPPLGPELFTAHRKAQRLRYPELYRQHVISGTNGMIQRAVAAHRSGNREEAADLLEEVVSIRRDLVGENDPLYREPHYFYYQLTGLVIVFKDMDNGWLQEELTPQQAQARGVALPQPVGKSANGAATSPAGDGGAAEADQELALASQKWKAKDAAGALEHAKRALEIRERLFGSGHPKVAEVQRMIDVARQGQ